MPAFSLSLSPVTAAVAVTLALLFAVWLVLSPKAVSLSNEPNSIPHWIPFFGHAFRFAKDKRTFFQWAE